MKNQLAIAMQNLTTSKWGFYFSEKLDRLAIIPMCMPTITLKERRDISWKNRYADVRLIIPYDNFIYGDQTERILLCKKNIQTAVEYVKRKDATFEADRFLEAVEDAFTTVYPE